MERARVRYVLTGACPVAYSGRVLHTYVQLRQPDGSATRIDTLKTNFCTNLAADMKDLAESIPAVRIRVLKAGRVLSDSDSLLQHLTPAEMETCLASADETAGDANGMLQKPSVLVHIVFQKQPPPPVENPNKEKNKGSNTAEGGNSGEGHEAKKDSCCCVM
ncbi:conserved hypothetical protein [Leishmania braziliensis MHOM/BR/75/M2904]|uniref:Uncharacterized protein n=2 Tax=Leishmania braziliensis TaxID=5660 RepID=A4HC23_LEIBR|nr:conserved hypothetical protein [Leishmania braziliensis MHOM/BR/75/M2904]CAJ2472688.1 unnamed protein product [Leishmania braziliensis]CAM38970.1 conserved hypothetical protein [Leishmania braziliensis MHOM/BR/75/M2904]SYZ65797.1 hypothetical_protein [Leishmania braziliensis MHOM/BR/75/M2904]